MASLRSDHIVRALDFYQDDTTAAIIMEYLEGRDFESYVDEISIDAVKRALPVEQVVQWYSQLLPAFEHAHSKGLVHRDVKPSNIFLTESGNIKVLDFGIAKVLEDAQLDVFAGRSVGTLTNSGTPYFKSPEHLLRPATVNHLTDIYALGLMFYILTTGTEPYEYEQLLEDILNKPLPEVPGYPAAIYQVVLKATSKKRDDRYATCGEFLTALLLASGNHVEMETPASTPPPPPQTPLAPPKAANTAQYKKNAVPSQGESVSLYSPGVIQLVEILGGFSVFFLLNTNFTRLQEEEKGKGYMIMDALFYFVFFFLVFFVPGLGLKGNSVCNLT